jgi:hypothetical protein
MQAELFAFARARLSCYDCAFHMKTIRFVYKKAFCDRRHYINEDDVMTVLNRLPVDIWGDLRGVYFTDRSHGVRILGYAHPRSREISICALPPRVSLSRFLVKGQTCSDFGAIYGKQWPRLAVRRFLLYDTLLHELGHLRLINGKTKSERLRFAHEKYAQEFADYWRKQLWSTPYEHDDFVHNPPL